MRRVGLLRRIGLLLKKVGCTRLYPSFLGIPVTLLWLEPTYIVSLRERDNSIILALNNLRNVAKPQSSYLRKNNVPYNSKLYESRVKSLSGVQLGLVSINHFVVGQYLDITGNSKGKGFAGVMQRHNFSGLRASHGVSIAHRSQGSTGQCQDPGKVFKGKKMAGRFGNVRVTAQNMELLSIDNERNLIVVKGNNVPGFKGKYVFVRDAIKKPLHRDILSPVSFVVDTADSDLIS
ncbi:50S ribosomal protein L3 [Wolbachia endosymbiont of Pentidionis agamae]|uniref:50S ribosomal protein L3 n=1 Tax=Wolbachia endosymbiont of Pentidionis agamae TaxID=3110435 RepID=UPI002FD60A0A